MTCSAPRRKVHASVGECPLSGKPDVKADIANRSLVTICGTPISAGDPSVTMRCQLRVVPVHLKIYGSRDVETGRGATMLTLYDFGNSVCCQKVRITMRAKGLNWEPIKVDLFETEQYDPKYLKLNPKGVVPTLVHDGKAVIESTLICEYIDETFPQAPQLTPADPWLQSRMRLWSKMVDEGLHDGVTEISFSAMFRERIKNMPPEVREKRFRNVGDPRRTDRFKSTYDYGVKSPFVAHGIAAYERAFKMLEASMPKGKGPWMLGSDPTLADINLMPYAPA